MIALVVRFLYKFYVKLFRRKKVEKVLPRPESEMNDLEYALDKIYTAVESYEGMNETMGLMLNPTIREFHSSVGLKKFTNTTPWCASGLNYCLSQVGFKGTGSALARSFLKWGVRANHPKKGTVVVLWRDKEESWKGHVTLFHDWANFDRTKFYGLGMNQDNTVCYKAFRTDRILDFRNPF